jgi:hypothetical protein
VENNTKISTKTAGPQFASKETEAYSMIWEKIEYSTN